MSSRYAQVDRCLWVDAKFLSLTSAPSAQLLFLWLLTSPEVGMIPGLIRIGLAGLAEAIGWSTADVERHMDELVGAGMAKVDWRSRLVWLPKALARNVPKAPQNMRPWGKAWAEVPECALKSEAWVGMSESLATAKPEWVELFAEICVHPDVKVPAEAKPPTKPPTKPGAMPREVLSNSEQPRAEVVSDSKVPGLTHKHEHEHEHEQKQDQPRAKPPASAAPALRGPSQEILTALAAWPVLAPLTNSDWVQAIRATASTAGWSQADLLNGIADFGEKRGPSAALNGTPDPGKLSDAITGFIKSAHLRRRSGVATGVSSSIGTAVAGPTESDTEAILAQQRAIVPAPADDPNRMAFYAALSKVGT